MFNRSAFQCEITDTGPPSLYEVVHGHTICIGLSEVVWERDVAH